MDTSGTHDVSRLAVRAAAPAPSFRVAALPARDVAWDAHYVPYAHLVKDLANVLSAKPIVVERAGISTTPDTVEAAAEHAERLGLWRAAFLRACESVDDFYAEKVQELEDTLRSVERHMSDNDTDGETDGEEEVVQDGTFHEHAIAFSNACHRLSTFCDTNRQYVYRLLSSVVQLTGEDVMDYREAIEGLRWMSFDVELGTLLVVSKNLLRFEIQRGEALPPAEQDLEASGSVEAVDVESVVVGDLPAGVHRFMVAMTSDSLGTPLRVPVICVQGQYPGPVLGLTCALHGDEVNGIRVAHRLVRRLSRKLSHMFGCVLAVLVSNVVGYERRVRYFDGVDLNRVFPGRADGDTPSQYVYHLYHKIVSQCDYLLDLHTASRGRQNSLYVRADMNQEDSAVLARLMEPQIIVHSSGPDGSLRGHALSNGIPAITVEIGDPSTFQPLFIRHTLQGVMRCLQHLGIFAQPSLGASPSKTGLAALATGATLGHVDGEQGGAPPLASSNNNMAAVPVTSTPRGSSSETAGDAVEQALTACVTCSRSRWIYTDCGGVLFIRVGLLDWLSKGDVIARVRDIWGTVIRTYYAEEQCIVVGRSTNPAARSGDRIVHLGFFDKHLAQDTDDGHR